MSTVREEWGLACPQCTSDRSLQVEFTCMAHVTPDGTDAVDDEHLWHDGSPMLCSACGYCASVARFKTTEPAQPSPPPTSPSRQANCKDCEQLPPLIAALKAALAALKTAPRFKVHGHGDSYAVAALVQTTLEDLGA